LSFFVHRADSHLREPPQCSFLLTEAARLVGTALFLNSAGQRFSPFQRIKPILFIGKNYFTIILRKMSTKKRRKLKKNARSPVPKIEEERS